MFYLRRLLSLIFLGVTIALIDIYCVSTDPIANPYGMTTLFELTTPYWLSPTMRIFLVILASLSHILYIFALCVLSFNDIITVNLKISKLKQALVTALLLVACFAFLIAWHININLYVILSKCSLYGKILLGVWLYLLYASRRNQKAAAAR